MFGSDVTIRKGCLDPYIKPLPLIINNVKSVRVQGMSAMCNFVCSLYIEQLLTSKDFVSCSAKIQVGKSFPLKAVLSRFTLLLRNGWLNRNLAPHTYGRHKNCGLL